MKYICNKCGRMANFYICIPCSSNMDDEDIISLIRDCLFKDSNINSIKITKDYIRIIIYGNGRLRLRQHHVDSLERYGWEFYGVDKESGSTKATVYYVKKITI